jgi:exopolysaccharide transport family protein
MNVQTPVHEDLLPLEPQGTAEKEGLQLAFVDLLQMTRTRLGVFLRASIGLFLAIVTVALLTPPRYTGVSRVMVDTRQNNTLNGQNVQQILSGIPTDQASILDQVQILKSRQLAGRVVDKLRLDLDPEFAPKLTGTSLLGYLNPIHYLRPPVIDQLNAEERKELLRDKTIDRFEGSLDVAQIQQSTAIGIEFQSGDPAKAARIANAIADAYVEDQLNAKLEATQHATQWISSRLGKLAQDARVSEAALEKYKADHHLTDVTGSGGSGSISVLDQQIAAATTQLMQAQVDRAQAEATLSRVRSLVNSGHAADVSQVVSSPLITQLRQQQAELVQKQAEMASRYGPSHPKMLDLIAEKRDLQTKIEEEIQHVVGTAANDVAVASARAGALEASLRQLEGRSSVQGQARVEERELEANSGSTRALYDSFMSRIKQTEQEQTLQIPDARVISRSPVPTSQSFPPLSLVFAASIPCSLIFGFLVVMVLEKLDHGFRTVARVEETLGLPVLATLPDMVGGGGIGAASRERGKVAVADEIIDRPTGTYAEAVRGLQMGLSLSNVDSAPRVIVVTSAVPAEGKTTTALSLARHAAQSGKKTILVDGDLRRPSVRLMTDLAHSQFDLIDVLQGTCAVDHAIVPDSRSSLTLLPATKGVRNAPDLLESQAMRNLVTQLSGQYDVVIIDSAPILPVNDTKILARLADAMLFVVRWEETPRGASLDAVKALRGAHAPLAGAVLSMADPKRFHYYSFGYAGYAYASAYAKYYEG